MTKRRFSVNDDIYIDMEYPEGNPHRAADQDIRQPDDYDGEPPEAKDRIDALRHRLERAPRRLADQDIRQPDDDFDFDDFKKESYEMTKAELLSCVVRELARLDESELAEVYYQLIAEEQDIDIHVDGEGAHIGGDDDDDDEDDHDDDNDEHDDDDNDDDDHDDDEKKEKREFTKEDFNFDMHLNALLENHDGLPEEFKAHAAVIFESALQHVAQVVSEQMAINEEIAIQEAEARQVEVLDRYLNQIVAEWMDQNEIAIETSIQSELTESFMDGLKQLFEEHYVVVPDEKVDIIEDVVVENERLVNEVNYLRESLAETDETLETVLREQIVYDAVQDLSIEEAEKIASLAENIEFTDINTYEEKVHQLKEAYSSKTDVPMIAYEPESDEMNPRYIGTDFTDPQKVIPTQVDVALRLMGDRKHR